MRGRVEMSHKHTSDCSPGTRNLPEMGTNTYLIEFSNFITENQERSDIDFTIYENIVFRDTFR